MIHDHDRSGWFGASDTAMIMGRWNTPSFARWWLVKLGARQEHYTNAAMRTGTAYEHRILDFIGVRKRDRQIKHWRLRLRVNLDGETPEEISEVKTYGGETFRISKGYWEQCQVEMFAAKKRCRIVAYRVLPEDKLNFFRPIDAKRLSYHPIAYDAEWIDTQYLPRLRYLAKCLRRGEWPKEEEYAGK